MSRPPYTADYSAKKRFYQDESVARDYDLHRFGSPERARRNIRKWQAITRALLRTTGVRSVLDLPCGTGRFTGHLAAAGYDVVAADVSMEMMQEAQKRFGVDERLHGFVRADAERLPLKDASVDCIMSIRFLHHIDSPTRIAIVREMARVSRRWLILDFRHKRSYRYLSLRLRKALGIRLRRQLPQVSRRELDAELRAAGVRVVTIVPVAWFFSDKWVVLGEKLGAS